MFDSLTFGDGSGLHGFTHSTRRIGFGVVATVMTDRGGYRPRTGAWGPTPGPQVVPLAELFGLVIYLRFAAPVFGKYTYVTDCACVAEGVAKGRHAMTNGCAIHASLWSQAFILIADLAPALVMVTHT